MTDALLDYAKEKLLDGKVKEAYDLVLSAKTLDPFFPGINRALAAYRMLYVATKKTKSGLVNYYELLELKADASLSEDTITDSFCRLVKFVHPDFSYSPAAPAAFRLIKNALELLCDEKRREAYDVSMGLRPPPSKPLPQTPSNPPPQTPSKPP